MTRHLQSNLVPRFLVAIDNTIGCPRQSPLSFLSTEELCAAAIVIGERKRSFYRDQCEGGGIVTILLPMEKMMNLEHALRRFGEYLQRRNVQ